MISISVQFSFDKKHVHIRARDKPRVDVPVQELSMSTSPDLQQSLVQNSMSICLSQSVTPKDFPEISVAVRDAAEKVDFSGHEDL